MPRQQQEKGKWGEEMAARFYLKNGFTILETNYRPTKRHEVDLIVQKDSLIVFVEVKVRQDDNGDPIEAVDDKKIRHIVLASDIYLHNLDRFYDVRYDVIGITGNPDSFELEHIPAAFIPPLF